MAAVSRHDPEPSIIDPSACLWPKYPSDLDIAVKSDVIVAGFFFPGVPPFVFDFSAADMFPRFPCDLFWHASSCPLARFSLTAWLVDGSRPSR
ncbi:hypothetical protein HU757_16705 [Rhizobium laguerreae]|nr:hypothetical protein [Rhizobium laguerreae]